MSKTILIIEDDVEIGDMLRVLLGQNGYQTVNAYSGTEGILVHNNNIDLILLDLMLPGKSGEEIIGELKKKHNVPIIVTSAIHDVNKKVDLFKLGADDYVTKPFHNEELIARITVRLKNGHDDDKSQLNETISYKDIIINKGDFSAKVGDKMLDISKTEFMILQLLIENSGRTCTKSMIYDNVWDYENSADDNTLNVHISKLRKKLKDLNPEEDYIETVWGIGYRLKK